MNCYATGNVGGDSSFVVGGLVGWNDNGTMIAFCYATGAVSGTSGDVGGLVGGNRHGTITSCYATGAINGIGSYTGGLIGRNEGGRITSCYATGEVSGTVCPIGGLIGWNEEYSTVTTCYATGNVRGDRSGGLVGDNYKGKIIRCFSTGKPTGSLEVGGLCGKNTMGGQYEDTGNFWDMETSQVTDSAMGVGKTTTQMKTKETFTGAGWDFVGEAENGTGDVWRMCADGVSYPRLSWEFSQGGDIDCPDGVALEDLVYLAGRWMKTSSTEAGAADGNGDGRVDLSDFEVLASNWMKE